MSKIYTILMFRHGEAFNSFDVHRRSDELGCEKMNSSLTEKGVIQANKLADDQLQKDLHILLCRVFNIKLHAYCKFL